jgi:hypothetical protein
MGQDRRKQPDAGEPTRSQRQPEACCRLSFRFWKSRAQGIPVTAARKRQFSANAQARLLPARVRFTWTAFKKARACTSWRARST